MDKKGHKELLIIMPATKKRTLEKYSNSWNGRGYVNMRMFS